MSNSQNDYPVVIVSDVRRLNKGTPWIYSNEILKSPHLKRMTPGQLVNLQDNNGKFLGVATFNLHSLISARILTKLPQMIDTNWFQEKLTCAMQRRSLLIDKPYYRLVHAEADSLPGFVVDRYDSVFVIQLNTAGAEQLCADFKEALRTLVPEAKLVIKREQSIRTREGLEVVHETESDLTENNSTVIGKEGNILFKADVHTGQKTGWFYDQRDNRALLQKIVKQKSVLDAYSFTGAFGLYAAVAGASKVTCLDSSQSALSIAKENAELNGVELELICDNAFTMLPKFQKGSYDVVIIDPPAFVKSKKDLNAGVKGYKKLVEMAHPLVKKGGYLLFTSCSHHVDLYTLQDALAQGVGSRTCAILKTLSSGPDHPLHPHLVENAYLKGFLCQLD